MNKHGQHLAIDAVGARYGGAAVVACAVVNAALAHPAIERVTLFSSPAAEQRFRWPAHENLRVIEPAFSWPVSAARLHWAVRGLAQAVGAAQADALLCLSNVGRGPRGVRSSLFIQQTVPFSREALAVHSLTTQARVLGVQEVTRWSARRCQQTLVQTPTMARWVARDFALPDARIFVVLPEPAVAPEPRPQPGQHLLYVGNDSPYKNLSYLGAALQRCAQAHLPHKLRITLPAIHPLTRRYAWQALGYLDPQALWQEYSTAFALVHPALVETVGLPLIEAMQAGLPVLVADRPYAHDVCGDAALFFDPLRPESLQEVLVKLHSSTALRQQLVQAGYRRVKELKAAGGYRRMLDLVLGLGEHGIAQRAVR